MTKTKRVTSVLLTLCLAVVMLVGVLVAAPVQVKAAGADYIKTDITVNGGGALNELYNGNNLDVQPGDQISMAIEADNIGANPATITARISVYPNIPGMPATVDELINAGPAPGSITGPSITIPAGTTGTVVYTFSITVESDQGGPVLGPFTFTLTSIGPPAPAPTPAPAPQEDTFWHDVLSGLAATDANGTFTVDATHHSFVPHFISQHLDLNSGKTIIVKTNLGNFRLTRARLLAAGLDVDYSYTYEELAAAGLLGGGAPQTGDTSNLPLWTLCGILALAGLALCTVLSRRKVTQR